MFLLFFSKSRTFAGLWIIIIYAFVMFSIENANILIFEKYRLLDRPQTLIEYILFTAFIYTQIKNPVVKRLIIISGVAFTLFLLILIFFIQITDRVDSIPIGVETLIVLSFAFYYLYEQTNDTVTLFIYNRPAFWIILGMVIYLAGSFFIYVFANYLNGKELDQYWVITNLLSILKNSFFCISIWINAKPPKSNLNCDLELSSLN